MHSNNVANDWENIIPFHLELRWMAGGMKKVIKEQFARNDDGFEMSRATKVAAFLS